MLSVQLQITLTKQCYIQHIQNSSKIPMCISVYLADDSKIAPGFAVLPDDIVEVWMGMFAANTQLIVLCLHVQCQFISNGSNDPVTNKEHMLNTLTQCKSYNIKLAENVIWAIYLLICQIFIYWLQPFFPSATISAGKITKIYVLSACKITQIYLLSACKIIQIYPKHG